MVVSISGYETREDILHAVKKIIVAEKYIINRIYNFSITKPGNSYFASFSHGEKPSRPKSDPYLSDELQTSRLIKDYLTHGNIVVGLDFDNTIYDCHHTPPVYIYDGVVELIKKCNTLNFTVCIWTANEDHSLVDSVCKNLGIKYNYLNDSPLIPNSTSRKPFFNVLLDDRAGLKSAFDSLQNTINLIEIFKEINDENN